MKLLFKQRFFSWFDSYDIYDEQGEIVYTVKGAQTWFAWEHCLKIYDKAGNKVGMVQEKIFTLSPKFEIYIKDEYVGCIRKGFNFFNPTYNVDFKKWYVEGNFLEWEYDIIDERQQIVGIVSKKVFNWTDTYMIDVNDSKDGLAALMLVLAIDAEKCSRG